MIDAIRRRQIDEVMNYDRNINIQTMISTGRAVSKMGDSTDLRAMQDKTVLDTTATSLNTLTTLLDQKRAAVVSMKQYIHTRAQEQYFAAAVAQLYDYGEVVTLYNQVTSNYLANNTPQTKQMVMSSIRRLLGDVSFVRAGLKQAVNDHIHFINTGNNMDYVEKYLSMLVISFCLYDLILEAPTST